MTLYALVLCVLAAQAAAIHPRRSDPANSVDLWSTSRPVRGLRRSANATPQPRPTESADRRQRNVAALSGEIADTEDAGDDRRVKRDTTLEPIAQDALRQRVVAGNRSTAPGSRDYSDGADDEADVDADDEAEIASANDDDDDERHDSGHRKKKKPKKKKKKKKGHHGFFSLMKKMKKHLPGIMHKMHGPSMFMMGMAQANFHNFVMHALMMSKMALTSVVVMIIREMVFGDKDQPVKYYNFGYDHHRRTLHASPYDYKRRRKRRQAVVPY